MANLTPTVVNFKMYDQEEDFVGIAQITLPTLSFMTQAVRGSGIMGEINVAIISELQSMQVQLQMLTLTEQGIKLMEHKIHTWEFREVQQTIDGTTGEHDVVDVKHVMRIFPISMDGGTLQPQSVSNPNITATVFYWAEYRDGVKVLELDPLNYICFINGVDYAAKIRKAMGMGGSVDTSDTSDISGT